MARTLLLRASSAPCHLARANPAFTLVELLVGAALAIVTVAGAASVIVTHTRSFNSSLWAAQTSRDFTRLTYFMSSEASEGCMLRTGAAPASCSASACVAGSGSDLRLLVPVLVNGTPANRVIRYYRDAATSQLLRDGPAILADGQLDTNAANDRTGSILLDNVSAFTATLTGSAGTADYCRSTAVTLTLAVPNSSASRSFAFNLAIPMNRYLQ